MPTKLTAALLTVLVSLGLAATGCSSASTDKTVSVYAAASLKATFTTLAKSFEGSHPGVKVSLNFAGSQDLVDQITGGASADVFASANEKNMLVITEAGLNAAEPKIFATNQLAIVVPPDNPAKISSFADLSKKGLKLVVCAPEVPCGAATEKVEKATGITLAPVSEEQAVTGVLAKVQAGEADAGLVYQTDVISAGATVKGINFPESSKAINSNPIVALKDGPQSALGQEFVDLVLSAEGQQVFATAGFGKAS